MWVVARKTLQQFWLIHPDAENALRAWHAEAEAARWGSPRDIKDRYSTASFVGSDRVVFNIGGNKFRLVVKIRYDHHMVHIRFIGTHVEYDKIDVATV